MAIIPVAGNDVPMQMRNNIAQAGEVDLVGGETLSQHLLNGEHHGHHMIAFLCREITHFLDVFMPDHAAKAGVIRIIHQYNAALAVLPERFAACVVTEFASHVSFCQYTP